MSTIRCIYSAEPNFPATDQHPEAVRYQVGAWWVDAIGGEPTEQQVAAALSPVPASITPLQARKALLVAGLLDDVTAYVAQQDQETQLAWDYASEVRRDNDTIIAAAAALGLTQQQLDELFVAAAGYQ